jgi:hypothetical protein
MRKLWIVTKPTKDSVIEDIIFNADAKELELQFKGGLKGEEISNWTFDEGIAHKEAHDLLISPETNEGIESKIKELISANKSDEEIVEIMAEYNHSEEMVLYDLCRELKDYMEGEAFRGVEMTEQLNEIYEKVIAINNIVDEL